MWLSNTDRVLGVDGGSPHLPKTCSMYCGPEGLLAAGGATTAAAGPADPAAVAAVVVARYTSQTSLDCLAPSISTLQAWHSSCSTPYHRKVAPCSVNAWQHALPSYSAQERSRERRFTSLAIGRSIRCPCVISLHHNVYLCCRPLPPGSSSCRSKSW
jgi:hypothetical protein